MGKGVISGAEGGVRSAVHVRLMHGQAFFFASIYLEEVTIL